MRESYKVGDIVKLISKRPDDWNLEGKMDKFLGKVVRITDIFDDRLVFDKMDGWAFSVNDIERHALPTEINIHSKEKPDMFKHIEVNRLLDEMIKADKELYVKILDTPEFANVLIPNDVSRCANNECELKNDCKRWLQYQMDIGFKRDTVFSAVKFSPHNGICNFKI